MKQQEYSDIGAHYERLTPVLEALGGSDGAHTLGVHDHHGWYRKKDASDVDLIDEGYDRRARPYDLHRDATEFLERIDRHYYAVLNYQEPEVLREEEPCRTTDEGTEWRDESPLPNYDDVEALTLFVDIDLRDEHKERPLPPEKRATFEDVVCGFVDAFGSLVGEENVYALDSVGGAYVFGAPRVTASIGDEFDGEERGWIFKELAARVRNWIDERADEVIQEADADELCKADLLVNINRQYKAPLSLHKSIDGVVHPLDTEDVSYDFVSVDAVDDALIDETVEWCEDFTASTELDDATEKLVSTLFEDFEGERWRDRLEAFVEDRRQEERERQERTERAAQRRSKGREFKDAAVTTEVKDVNDALDDIDVGKVVRDYASDEWDTSNRKHETTFNPSWRKSGSGESCAVDNNGNRFVDNSCNGGGDAAKAYALGEGIISHADEDLTAEELRRAVNGLRSEGYEIPVWVPEEGTPKSDGGVYEQTPLWGLRKAAVALDVLDADDFIEKETDDGDTYEDFPHEEARNATLDALEEEGIEHGQQRSVTDNTTPEHVDLVEADGGYAYIKYNDNDEPYTDEVANFLIETDARVEHAEDGTKVFKLTVMPRDREPYNVDVEPKAFNSAERFENEVVTGFTTRFDGGKTARNDLRELVGLQDAEVLKGTNLMGLHGDEFVTPSGTLTEDGWADESDTVLVERDTDIERRWSLSPDDDYAEEDVDDILRLLPQIRHRDRFLTVLGWFYSAPLKPLFLEWVGEFPLLSVTGDTGSGKTSTLQTLWRAFGMDDDPLSVDATPHAQLTSFSSSKSVPVWFDEYRPADISGRRADKFHDYARKTTRGASEAKGNRDRSTTTYRIKAPIVVSGEQRFQDPSLVRRSVLTNFRTDSTDEGTKTQRAYARLTGESFEDEDGVLRYPEPRDLQAHAFEYYRWLLGTEVNKLEEVWRDCRHDVEEVLARHEVAGLDSSERTALQVVLFGLRLYQQFAEARGANIPIDADTVDEDVEDALVHSAKNVGDGDGGRRSHLDEFIELLGRAAMDGYLKEDEHYTFIRDGRILRFNLSMCYDKVSKYHSDHGLSATLFKMSEYRSRLKDENDGRGYVETISQNTPPINRSVGIYLEEASEAVDISESMFTNGDGSGGDEPTPLNTVEHGTRTTVIAEAHDQYSVDNDEIAQLGTLEDAVGSLNFVVWDTGNGTQTLRRGECYRLRNVKVDTYREETQIQVDEYTEVENVERDTCWLTPEGNNCNERISETPRSVIVEEVRGEDGLTEDELLDRVVNRGVDREEAKASLNRHCRNGVIIRNNGLRLA